MTTNFEFFINEIITGVDRLLKKEEPDMSDCLVKQLIAYVEHIQNYFKASEKEKADYWNAAVPIIDNKILYHEHEQENKIYWLKEQIQQLKEELKNKK